MKSIKLFISIVFVLFLLDKIVFFVLLTIDKNVMTGEGVGKINQFNIVKDTTQYIVFGNSRANHHIDPKVFGNSAYNIGVGGRKMAYSATLIQTLPKHKKQHVLLQIDPPYVYDTTYVGSDIDALYIKYHQNDVIKNKIDEIGRQNHFSIFFWSLDYNGKVFSLITNLVSPKYDYKNYKGFDPMENTVDEKIMFIKRLKRIKKHVICPTVTKPSYLEEMYLRQIKDFCDQNNKKLILFTSPVYQDKCKEDNRKMVLLMRKYAIKYYDFTDYFKNDDNLDNWKDENHLSKLGATKFSKFLANALKDDLK